jgi:uncharacterized protein with PIN domain
VSPNSDESGCPLRFACDAMCGGLARWLRAYGYDTTYTKGIEDRVLIEHALREGRVLISSDGPMFERKILRDGTLRAFRLPRGLKLLDQFREVVRAFRLPPLEARCTICNGELDLVGRDAVADRVPAKSLIWATEFYLCRACGKAYWNGSHWRRIEGVRRRMAKLVEELA